MSFEDFKRAWEPDRGFGVPARVFSAVSIENPREVLTVGFVDVDPAALDVTADAVADQEGVRHDRIDEVIESTELRGMVELRGEHDFSAAPARSRSARRRACSRGCSTPPRNRRPESPLPGSSSRPDRRQVATIAAAPSN